MDNLTPNQVASSQTISDDSDVEIIDYAPKAKIHPLDKVWPVETHLRYPIGAGGKISMRQQTKAIQRLAQIAIQYLYIYICFEGAFPDADARIRYNRESVYNAAKDLEFNSIANRIQKDRDYADILSALVSLFFRL